ncbi:TIGR01244 family sulfur transferase [Qipengyuania thermophila]|uniref:TIGR01244 family sulfur transferase n=1 Tax=Qipengyuania thermophila TaxID=2509361 RepID=UPI001F3FEA8F|nr:TIGR01244 family sulfur transferase [Qipengyuania thermophila]
MNIRPIDDTFSVAPQIAPEDLPELARSGYRVLISNRPDGEEEGQPTAQEMRAAANAAGMTFHHIPVSGGAFPEDAVSAFRAVRQGEAKKTLAFCRTGTRAISLETLANPANRSPEERLRLAKEAGYDLSSLAARIKT